MSHHEWRQKTTNVDDLLSKLAAEEDTFLDREFLAPTLRGGVVRVRIGGVNCRVRIQPTNFEGWGVFRPSSHTDARLVRRASLAERRGYLQLFPLVRLIVCRRTGTKWFGSAASFGDSRVQVDGMAPLLLAEEVQLFECVRTRFDGAHFWFDEPDPRHDPGSSVYLRSALQEMTPPEDLERPGLTAEDRAAYELNFWESADAEAQIGDELNDQEQSEPPLHSRLRRRRERKRDQRVPEQAFDPIARRLRESLSHAGAQLVDYLERPDSFRVRYSVRGRQFTSSVDKHDLSVQVAGICLSGEDQKFDLGSLVGVLREGRNSGAIYQVGNGGMPEEEYWRVHPRRNR